MFSGDTDCWFESAVHLQLHIWSCGTGKVYTHSRLVAEREVAFTLFTSVGYAWTAGLASQRRDGGQSRYRSKGSSAHRRRV